MPGKLLPCQNNAHPLEISVVSKTIKNSTGERREEDPD
jgi:hypothetical protein